MSQLQLANEFLELRRARMSEAPLLARAVRESLADLAPFLPWATEDYDVEAARAFLEFSREESKAGRGEHLNVFEVESGELLGGVGIMFRRLHQSAELGYWMRSDRAGEGIATEASELIVEHAFDEMALRRVYLTCDVDNLGSRRVAEKLGMRREGRLKEFTLHHDESRDHYLYALLAREFKPAFRG